MLLLLKTPGMWEGWDFAPFFWGGGSVGNPVSSDAD